MNDPLSKLPLFATDREIAIAVVGKERASMYVKAAIPMLERHGFPRIDVLHGGRPVPLVRKWYNLHMGVDRAYVLQSLEPPKENPDAWRSAREKRNERKPQLGLNTRCLGALRYMVEHPDVGTSAEIPGATDFTLQELAAKGAVKEGRKDAQGDRTWTVTGVGREEMARVNDWHWWEAAAVATCSEDKQMTDAEHIEQLEAKIQQAYQVIGVLLAGPDGECEDFSSPGGQRTLDYFGHEDYDDDFLPYVHPRLGSR